MKNKLLILPAIALLFTLSACKQNDNSYQRYKRYLATLEDNEPISYVDWLETINGKDGKDAQAPTISRGENGHWFINDVDTGISYIGAKGDQGDKGQKGEKGEKGDKGETGDDAVTPYEAYKASHPEYTGTESDWYNDLANGAAGVKEIFTVTFDSDGGSEVASQEVMQGEKIVKPENPTKEGYIFKCWTYENEPWSFIGLPVVSDMTLVAIWE